MTPKYILRRRILIWSRPNLISHLTTELFPKMAIPETAIVFPGADALITIIKDSITDYGKEHGLHHTIAAGEDWEDIKTETSDLFDYIDDTADNDQTKLELTGEPIAIPKGHGTPDPQTGRVTNVKIIAEGGLLFRAEYESDEYAHHFRGRTKLHGAPESDWFEEGTSQNHTMYFTSKRYPRGSDVDVEIMASGTLGEANEWSALEFDLVR